MCNIQRDSERERERERERKKRVATKEVGRERWRSQ